MSNELIEKKEEGLTAAQTQGIIAPSDVWTNKDSFNQMLRAADMLSKTAIIPATYQNRPQDCFVAIEMATRIGVSPMMVMQNMFVVKGKPSWSGQACMALIESSGKFKHQHPVYFGEKGTDSRGCYLTATRVSDGTIVDGAEVTIAMAKAEGWWSKKDKYGNETSKWQTMPELMLAYRSAAFFARVNCPEMLMGVQTTEEIYDISDCEPQTSGKGLTDALKKEPTLEVPKAVEGPDFDLGI